MWGVGLFWVFPFVLLLNMPSGSISALPSVLRLWTQCHCFSQHLLRVLSHRVIRKGTAFHVPGQTPKPILLLFLSGLGAWGEQIPGAEKGLSRAH